MSSGSSTIVLVGLGIAVLLGLLFLIGGQTEPADPGVPSLPTTPVGDEGGVARAPSTGSLTVDIGGNLELGERERILLRADLRGAAAGTLQYRWSAANGLGFFSAPHARETYYTAPSSCDCEDRVLITLTVIDGRGRAAVDSIYVSVRGLVACSNDPCPPPTSCVSSPAICPTDDPCPAPDVPCDAPCMEVIPPQDGCDALVLPCPCEAGDCATGWMETWPFIPREPLLPSQRPTARIVRHFPAHVREGGTVSLEGRIHNPGCASACFLWTASKGTLEGGDTLTPTFHAPTTDRSDGETVAISLVVYDGAGGRSYDQIRITIDDLSSP